MNLNDLLSITLKECLMDCDIVKCTPISNENGDIVIESCIPTTDEEFMPELVHAVIDVVLKHLNEEYPKLMKTVWSN